MLAQEVRRGCWVGIQTLLLLAINVLPALAQERGGTVSQKSRPCEGTGWVFNGVELGALERATLSLALGQGTLPAGCYWYDSFSGMVGVQGGPPAGDLPAGMYLGGPLRADASNGNTGVFLNGREVTKLEVENLKKFGVKLGIGRYWINEQGIGGHEGRPAEFRLDQAQAQAAQVSPMQEAKSSPDRPKAHAGDHLYQSGQTHGGIQGNCVFISGPGYSFMGEGC
jgi:hypothetical protein